MPSLQSASSSSLGLGLDRQTSRSLSELEGSEATPPTPAMPVATQPRGNLSESEDDNNLESYISSSRPEGSKTLLQRRPSQLLAPFTDVERELSASDRDPSSSKGQSIHAEFGHFSHQATLGNDDGLDFSFLEFEGEGKYGQRLSARQLGWQAVDALEQLAARVIARDRSMDVLQQHLLRINHNSLNGMESIVVRLEAKAFGLRQQLQQSMIKENEVKLRCDRLAQDTETAKAAWLDLVRREKEAAEDLRIQLQRDREILWAFAPAEDEPKDEDLLPPKKTSREEIILEEVRRKRADAFQRLHAIFETRDRITSLLNTIKEMSGQFRKELLERDYVLLARLIQDSCVFELMEPHEHEQQLTFLKKNEQYYQMHISYTQVRSNCSAALQGIRKRIAFLVSALHSL